MICVHRLRSLPEKPAAIDWSYYRSAVANTGMVDQFEKQVTDDTTHLNVCTDYVIIRHSDGSETITFLCVSFQFNALKIPEPVDTQSALINAQEEKSVSVTYWVFPAVK